MLQTVWGGLLFISAATVLSVVGLAVVRRFADVAWLKRQHEVASFFFLMIGTLYAVLIAFAIYQVWTGFEAANANLEYEANEVGDLSRLSLAMPEPLRSNVRAALTGYIDAVVQDEFPAMAAGHESQRTWQAVEQLWRIYITAPPSTVQAQANYAESLQHLDRLANFRRIRVTTSRGTVPQLLWFLLYMGGTVLIAFTYFFGHDSLLSQGAMTAALTLILTFSLFLIAAYDSPYAGVARVSSAPFQLELQHVMARR